MNEREFLEKVSPLLDGFWEYICRVTNDVPFKNGDWGRGGRMLIMMPPAGTGFKFDIAAERLWATTDPENDEKHRKPLPNATPWRGEGAAVYKDNELYFEYFPSDVAGKGVTKDTIRLVEACALLYVGLGEFNHLHEDGTQTVGAVELRKMQTADDFKFAPKGIHPAGTVLELKGSARRIRHEERKPQRETLVVTMTGGGSLVIGSGTAVSNGPISIPIGVRDLQSLRAALEGLQISSEDINEIERVAAKEEPREGGLGDGVAGWIGRMFAKSLTGAWKVGKDVSSSILSEIFLRYYGLKS